MRAVLFVTCFFFLAAAGRLVYADPYPAFATIDGTGVSSPDATTSQVFEAPALLNLEPIVETPAPAVEEHHTPPANFSKLLWGYEAAFANSRLLAYDIGPPTTFMAQCVPDAAAGGPNGNGRGVAFDPLDGNLWITRLTIFAGDGFIHKVSPPNVTPGVCPQVDVIPFGDGPGGTIQDDIGALDVDEATKHIWAAGYTPLVVPGLGLRSFIYLVNRNDGSIIRSCHVPFGGGGLGNDTLAVFRATDLPGSSKYLLTDAGEEVTPLNGNMLLVIDQATCQGGAAVTPVAMVAKTAPMTGIDFEWPGLLSTDLRLLRDHDDFPFAAAAVLGTLAPSVTVEDISLCGFRAVWEGDGIGGNDKCPY